MRVRLLGLVFSVLNVVSLIIVVLVFFSFGGGVRGGGGGGGVCGGVGGGGGCGDLSHKPSADPYPYYVLRNPPKKTQANHPYMTL